MVEVSSNRAKPETGRNLILLRVSVCRQNVRSLCSQLINASALCADMVLLTSHNRLPTV